MTGRTSSNAVAHIALFPNHHPERFALDPLLGGPLDLREESRAGIMAALWTYIKKNNLQDADDRKHIKCDPWLKRVRRARPAYFDHDSTTAHRSLAVTTGS
jgi:SWI/SNF-related matrix-associated actin-dependent regulator of chromatin subfamily D